MLEVGTVLCEGGYCITHHENLLLVMWNDELMYLFMSMWFLDEVSFFFFRMHAKIKYIHERCLFSIKFLKILVFLAHKDSRNSSVQK